jgi:hypothetical protein
VQPGTEQLDRSRGISWRIALPALIACIVAGVLISALPHFLNWMRTGRPVWLADHDDLDVYVLVGGHSYLDHAWRLTDPVWPGGETYLPSLQLLPGILIAKVAHLDPIYINFMWRILAGLAMAATWFLVFRWYFLDPWIACALSILFMFDCGVVDAKPLIRQIAILARYPFDHARSLTTDHPEIFPQWRVMDPGLLWPFLGLYIWSVARALDTPNYRRISVAGVAFGLTFTNFYLWTAIGLALLIAFLFDRSHRRVYFHIAWLGCLVGSPFLLADFLFTTHTSPDWMHRVDYFLPISHFSELLFRRWATLLAVATLYFVWTTRRELFFLWALAASALILENAQLITGLQIENFHWHYVWGPMLWLLVVLIIVKALLQLRPAFTRMALAAVVVFIMLSGLFLRTVEATQTVESIALTRMYDCYRSQGEARGARFEAGSTVGGDTEFASLAGALDDLAPLDGYWLELSAFVDDRQWQNRIALNAFLLGQDRNSFAHGERELLHASRWGPWARSESARSDQLADRLRDYDVVVSDPVRAMNQFNVHYVALRADLPSPEYLARGWTRVQAGPCWQVWSRDAVTNESTAASHL